MDDLHSSYKRFLNSVEKIKHQNDDMDDLHSAYKKVGDEVAKAKARIVMIDRIIENCDRLSKDYWYETRKEAVGFLNGVYEAYDILFKAINK